MTRPNVRLRGATVLDADGLEGALALLANLQWREVSSPLGKTRRESMEAWVTLSGIPSARIVLREECQWTERLPKAECAHVFDIPLNLAVRVGHDSVSVTEFEFYFPEPP